MQVKLGGKIISIEDEVIDGPIDYNLLLGHTWVYAMVVLFSTYFHMITFLHKGGILAIDKLTIFPYDSHVTISFPLVGETLHSYQHVGVGLMKDSSLMGTFSLPPPPLLDSSSLLTYINMISSSTILTDPWVVPDEANIHSFGDRISLSPIELDYEAIYLACLAYSFSSINWVDRSLYYGTSYGTFSHTSPIDESIMEITMLDYAFWNVHHHHSSLPDSIEDNLSDVYLPNIVETFTSSFSIHEVDSEKNLSNIEETIPLDISVKLGIAKNICIGGS